MSARPSTAAPTSFSAAALHARLQAATREARLAGGSAPRPGPARRRRPTAAETWALLQAVPHGRAIDRTLSTDRALQRILGALLAASDERWSQTDVDAIAGPVLVIRSAPWPVLRGLLTRLATNGRARPLTVLCHRRDEEALATLSASVGLEVAPLFYPRFEAFDTSTLRRLVAAQAWRTAVVLDASKTGRGESLEHVTTALAGRDAHVWNASGTAWRQRRLAERLSREDYRLVRGLLRWHAASPRG